MGILDDPTDPSAVENLRRSIAMLKSGQTASIDRDRALVLLESLQHLQHQHTQVVTELHALLRRLEAP